MTGALLTHQDWFVQALEGDEATVRGLYELIYRDDRHERVSAVIETGTVEARVFGRWSMAMVSDDGESDIPLLMNVDKGGISPAAPRPDARREERPGVHAQLGARRVPDRLTECRHHLLGAGWWCGGTPPAR